jgi:hypothetical protein
MLAGEAGVAAAVTATTPSTHQVRAQRVTLAAGIRDFLLSGRFEPAFDTPTADGPEATATLRRDHAEAKESALRLVQLFFAPWPQGDPNRRIHLFNAAKSAFPYLTPDECDAVWRRLESGPFAGALSPAERDYVALFKAIGGRDAAAMWSAATRLLETEGDVTPARRRYLLAAALLGGVAGGRPRDAERLWARHGPATFPSGDPGLLVRMLLAQIPAP